jgi:hypothetical protein
MPDAEDERLGQLLRAIRRRSGQRQIDLARAAGLPRRDVVLIETGRAADVLLGRSRRVFAAADARLRVTAWWNGAAADRLLDERHAALVERVGHYASRHGWLTAFEVTFSEWGERGSVDILAGRAQTRAVAVIEIKASVGSLEETNRVLDIKVRLAAKLAKARFGWLPASVSRVLILPADKTLRRIVDRHTATMSATYPARSREIRTWLTRPTGAIAGIWFVSEVRDTNPRVR